MKNNWFIKYELLISMLLIIIYLVLNSFCMHMFGSFSYQIVILNGFLSLCIMLFIWKNNLFKYCGLNVFPNCRKYLYFIPLILIVSVNLWSGININNNLIEIIFYMGNMLFVGFLEEIIFRGFLFQMMARDNIKLAIIISSVTFGIGHIVNLLNGALFLPTLMQVMYAISIGYLFSVIVHKSKSLWPCIITHALFNALSIFYINNDILMYVSSIFLIVVPVFYARYIDKFVK